MSFSPFYKGVEEKGKKDDGAVDEPSSE